MNKAKHRVRLVAVSALALLWVCAVTVAAEEGKTRHELRGRIALEIPWGLDVFALKIPEDNPLTAEKIEVGKLLFFDPLLSADGSVSCADCHSPRHAFTDGEPVAKGIRGQKGRSSSPTIVNRAFSTAQFWDGRAASLEEQAKGPMLDRLEMGNGSHEEIAERVGAIEGYRRLFAEAFGSEEVTIDRMAQAIASFERTLLSGNSPYDRFRMGNRDALSPAARNGLALFEGKAGCATCHAGFNFTDEEFHTLGRGYRGSDSDLGLYQITRKEEDRWRFKTPTLREVALTAPYMHDGRFDKLEDVVEFYDRGGIEEENYGCGTDIPFLSGKFDPLEWGRVLRGIAATIRINPTAEIRPLDLSKREKRDLVQFLKALSGKGWQHVQAPPHFPR